MSSPARRRALTLQARRRALDLLNCTPAARVIGVQDVFVLPPLLQAHWEAFIRIEKPLGEALPRSHDSRTRTRWIAEPLEHRQFPLRLTLVLFPTAIYLDMYDVVWLQQLDTHLKPFDVVLIEGEQNMLAFSDDEDALRRLVVCDGQVL
ncbi:hypothetical protein [Deinococcus aestuarii]|uniref:hypothetical protein n=1 Tax=Deinococcus aestuarii TaxID=2774531 RepID=UPI001C0B552A|nr:hypothetical protein [Deinococcus aestuarii]